MPSHDKQKERREVEEVEEEKGGRVVLCDFVTYIWRKGDAKERKDKFYAVFIRAAEKILYGMAWHCREGQFVCLGGDHAAALRIDRNTGIRGIRRAMARPPEDRGVQRVDGSNGSTIGDKIQYNLFIFVLRSVVLVVIACFVSNLFFPSMPWDGRQGQRDNQQQQNSLPKHSPTTPRPPSPTRPTRLTSPTPRLPAPWVRHPVSHLYILGEPPPPLLSLVVYSEPRPRRKRPGLEDLHDS